MARRRRTRPKTKMERYQAALAGMEGGNHQDKLRRFQAAAGALGSNPSAGRTAGASGSTSVIDTLKKVGETALNTLSVPGAALVTTLTNAVQAAKGDPGVSWKNLAGYFRDDYAGGAGLLRSFGVDNAAAERWGGLGIDVALDPTWLLGVVPGVAPLKAGQVGARFARLARVNELGREADEVVRGGRLFIENPRTPNPEKAVGRLLDPEVSARLIRLRAAANKERYLMATEGFIPKLRLGIGQNRYTAAGARVRKGEAGYESAIKVPRGLQVPLSSKPRFARDPQKENWFRTSPLRNLFHGTNMGSHALAEFQDKAIRELRDLHGLTEAEGTMLGLHVLRKNEDAVAEAAWRQAEVDAGRWKPAYDEVVQQHDALMKAQSNALGLKDWQQQIAKFRQFAGRPDVRSGALRSRRDTILRGVTQRHLARAAEAQRPLDEARDVLTQAQRDLARAQSRLALLRRQKVRIAPTIKVRKGQRYRSRYTAYMDRQIKQAEKDVAALTERVDKASKAVKDVGSKVSKNLIKLQDRFIKTKAHVEGTFGSRLAATEAKRHGEFVKYAKGERLSAFLKPVKVGKGGQLTTRFRVKKGSRLRTMEEMEQLAVELAQRGGYAHRTMSREMEQAMREWRTQQMLAGKLTPDIIGDLRSARDLPDVLKERQYESITQWLTRDRFIEQLKARGIDEAEAARQADEMTRVFQFAKEPQMFPRTDVELTPEFNIFAMMSRREAQQASAQVEEEMIRMIEEVGLAKTAQEAEQVFRESIKTYRTSDVPYSFLKALGVVKKGEHAGENRISLAMAYLKAYFTVLNPAHYFTNAWGSFVNSLINGTWQHGLRGLGGSLGLPKKGRDLGRMEGKDAVYRIGDRTYSGDELMVLGRLSGLGLGFSGEEVETLLRIHNSGKKRDFLTRLATNWNMNRENADRMWAWMNHMRAGEDPFTAAAKVLRYAFDYSNATHWERVWGRNLILFYTWFKNNLIFQGYGLLTRPGMYHTLASIENSRPKFPNEPDHWSKLGGFGTPFGLLTYGNPMADIFKYEVSLENFRRNLLGATNPLARIPTELALNRSFWLGGDIKKFEGQDTPHVFARLQRALGIPGTTLTRANAEGELQPGYDAYLSYFLSQFMGPQGNLATHITNPDEESSDTLDYTRLTGFRLWPVEQEKWDRAAAYLRAKRKADRTRERTYERP